MLQFMSNGKTYKGFDKAIRNAKMLGVVYFQGDIDLWSLENLYPEFQTAQDELKRYYKEMYEENIDIRLFARILY